mgnify:CR=1 FL=1
MSITFDNADHSAAPARPPAWRPASAARDIARGAALWRTWLALGWHDVRQRYKRSVLGPLWITLSMGITVAALGLLYARLFAQPIDAYLPFVALGFIVWALVSGVLLDACAVFVAAEGYIRQIALPLSFYVYRMVWRHFIVFAHNLLIFVVVAFVLPVQINGATLLVLPALLLLAANALWVGLMVGMVCTRYRDVPQIVTSVVQVAFFLTPIVWQPGQLVRESWVVDINPFFHLVELVRAPLLGAAPSAMNWSVAALMAVAGSACTFLLFARYRYRIVYWV